MILAGDLNIDLLDHLPALFDVFNLKNLVKEITCFMPDERVFDRYCIYQQTQVFP